MVPSHLLSNKDAASHFDNSLALRQLSGSALAASLPDLGARRASFQMQLISDHDVKQTIRRAKHSNCGIEIHSDVARSPTILIDRAVDLAAGASARALSPTGVDVENVTRKKTPVDERVKGDRRCALDECRRSHRLEIATRRQ